MVTIVPSLMTDAWVQATWDEFVALCDRLDGRQGDRPEGTEPLN
jgi:hypothetical protein